MRNLNRSQTVAVIVGLAFIAYLLFTGPIMNLFNTGNANINEVTQSVELKGVRVEEEIVGTGVLVEPGDTLSVHYVGTLEDGQVFDSSVERNTPFNFILGVGQVIRGWDEGLVGMRVGGKRIIRIAPEYAYGEQAIGPIPANSTLIFAVEVLDVEKPTQTSEQ